MGANLSELVFYPYRAFLSYSHKDTPRCEWLLRGLEAYRVDRDLIGRITTAGTIPRDLRPVFRDRDEFSVGSLKEQTLQALRGSQFLVVVASPASAASDYVNEEIRLFKQMRGDANVFALIAEGDAPANFPPALRHHVGADGVVTQTPFDSLAGDIAKDGEREAFVKIVAGLLGLPYDYVWMRDVKAQKKRAKARAALGGAFAVAASAAAWFGYEHLGTRQAVERHEQTLATHDVAISQHGADLAEIKKIVDQLVAAAPAQARETPGLRQGVAEFVQYAAAGAQAGDTRLAQAYALLKENKVAEAASLFRQVAEAKEQAAQTNNKEAAEAWRRLGAIAQLHEPWKARDYYARAVALDPSNAKGLYLDGWMQLSAKNLGAAEKSYRALLALESANEDQKFWARSGLADIAATRGDLPGALKLYRVAQEAMQRLAAADAGNAEGQRDLSVSYDNIGDVLVSQGNLPEALKSYRASLAIFERLAAADAGNAQAQRDLSVSYENIGDVLVRQGNLPEALKFYRASLAIRERLAAADAGNAEAQRDLSLSYERIGDVLVKEGNLPEALKSYRASLAIRERLAAADAGNAQAQRDLSLSYERIGDVLVKEGNLPEALKSYRASLAIRERLAAADAGNAEAQRDLSVSYENIGNVLVSQGNLPEALKSYRASLAIRERLAADAGNAEAQRDLSLSYEKIGDVLVKEGNLPEALKSYRASLAIRERLAAADAGNAEAQRDLSVSYSKFGDVYAKEGKRKDALENYHRALAVMERLASIDSSNAQWRADIIELNYDIATNGEDSAARFSLVAEQLKKLKTEHGLTAEQADWLAKSEMKRKKLVPK